MDHPEIVYHCWCPVNEYLLIFDKCNQFNKGQSYNTNQGVHSTIQTQGQRALLHLYIKSKESLPKSMMLV